MAGVDAVLHAATLHKPHVGSHSPPGLRRHQRHGHARPAGGGGRGRRRGVRVHEHDERLRPALTPADGAPAAWITEDVVPRPRNIYGATKVAAEDLCELVARDHGLPCLILRTSRFFPEPDDSEQVRTGFDDVNAKVNELLYRRIDLADVVEAHLAALPGRRSSGSAATSSAPRRRSGRTTSRSCTATPRPWSRACSRTCEVYERLGWRMFPRIDRVYVNARARADLAWSAAL